MGIGNYTEDDVTRRRAPSPAGPSSTKIPRLPVRPLRLEVRVSPGGPRRRREDVPRPQRATSTARTSSTSSCSSRPAPSSSAATCTTSSSPTSRRCRPGTIEPPRDPAGDRHAGDDVPRIEVRHHAGAARAVQLGLLQERPLQASEVPGRGGRRHASPGGRLRAAEAGLRRAVDAAVLHGPGSAESADGRGLAHRQGVDQQRLADVAHQLRRRAGRQSRTCPACRPSSTG